MTSSPAQAGSGRRTRYRSPEWDYDEDQLTEALPGKKPVPGALLSKPSISWPEKLGLIRLWSPEVSE